MQRLKKFLSVLTAVLVLYGVFVTPIVTVNALSEDDGYIYTQLFDGTYEIVDYVGDGCYVTIPERGPGGGAVTSIGKDAFNRCDTLSTVTIPKTINSIGECAFAGCRNLISVSISSGVSVIGIASFTDCRNLTNVTLSDGLTYIDSFAFDGCSSLSNLTIPSTVKAIEYNAFKETPFNENLSDEFTIVGDGVLLDSKCNNEIVTIPNGVKYIAYMGSKNEKTKSVIMPDSVTGVGTDAFHGLSVLEDIKMSKNINYVGRRAFRLTPFFDNNQDEFLMAGNVLIKYSGTSKQVCVPEGVKSVSDFLVFGVDSVLLPDSLQSIGDGAFWGGYLESIEIPKNVKTIGKEAFAFSDFKSIKLPYGLTQIGRNAFQACKKLSSLFIPPTVNNMGEEILYGAYYVNRIYVSEDSYAEYYMKRYYPEGLNTRTDSPSLKMDDITINIPDNVPLLGGDKLEMNFNKIPLNVKIKGNTVRMTIGDAGGETDADWATLKRKVANASQRLPNSHSGSSTSKYGVAKTFGTQFDISVFGYAEATFKDYNVANMQDLHGSIVIQMSAKLSRQWQTLFFSVPILIKCNGEVSISQGAVLGYDFAKNTFYMSGETELVLPKIRASAGVGVAYLADVSVYGQASNTLTIEEPSGHTKAALSGELGVSASLLNYIFEQPLLSGTWEYYNSQNRNSITENKLQNLQSPKNFKFDRSYLEKQSDWLGNRSNLLRSVSSSEKTLQTDIYHSAAPKLVTTPNGITMMVWTTDITSRTDGNHTAAVYSLYNSMLDTWSTPQIISDDGTADFSPDVTAVGNDIYVTWVNLKQTVASNITPDDMANLCEIAVAKFDGTQRRFGVASNLTNNNTLDIMPSISAVNGQPYVVWINNSNSDLFAQSGTNAIKYAQVSNPVTAGVYQYTSANTPIVSVSVGALNGRVNFVYAKDTDGNLSTTNDIELYGGPLGRPGTRLTDNTEFEQNPQFANLNGKDLLLWYSGNNLYQTENMTEINPIFEDGDYTITPSYSVVSGNGNNAIVCVSDSEHGSDAYAYLLDGTVWSKPIPVTSVESYVKYANGYFDSENKLNIVYTKTDAQIGGSSITQQTDLCMSSIEKSHNISVIQADYDEYGVQLGSTLPVDLTVTNNGMLKETGLNIVVKNGNAPYYSTSVQQKLEVGESSTVHIDLPIASSYNSLVNYTVEVLPLSGTDSDITDNSCTVSIGHPDLQISLTETDSLNGTDVKATVVNNGLCYSSGKLRVRKGSPDGEILAEYNLEPLGVGTKTSRTVTAKNLSSYASDGDTLYFEVTADKTEIFTGDNNDFIAADIKYILGDADNNGSVSTADTLTIQKYQSSLIDLDEIQKQAADVNKDGEIGTADVLLLQKYLANQLTDTQIGKEQSYIKK